MANALYFQYREKNFTFTDYTRSCCLSRDGSLIGLLIDDKQVKFPSTNKGFGIPVLLTKQVIVLKEKDRVIQIKLTQAAGELIAYVYLHAKADYLYATTSEPIPLSLAAALKKCASIKQDFPNFNCQAACYNEHGVVLYSAIGKTVEILYATANEEKVKKPKDIELADFFGHTITIPDNSYFHFSFERDGEMLINHSHAVRIDPRELKKEKNIP